MTTLVVTLTLMFHSGPKPATFPSWWYTAHCTSSYCTTNVVQMTPPKRRKRKRHSTGAVFTCCTDGFK